MARNSSDPENALSPPLTTSFDGNSEGSEGDLCHIRPWTLPVAGGQPVEHEQVYGEEDEPVGKVNFNPAYECRDQVLQHGRLLFYGIYANCGLRSIGLGVIGVTHRENPLGGLGTCTHLRIDYPSCQTIFAREMDCAELPQQFWIDPFYQDPRSP